MIAIERKRTLSEAEKLRWSQLREDIKRDSIRFWALVANSREVHHRRLYRDDFDSFEEFCDVEVKISKNRLFELFGALETKERIAANYLPVDGLSVRALQELKDVPDESMGRVLDASSKIAGPRISPVAIKQAKNEVLNQPAPVKNRLPQTVPPSQSKRPIQNPLERFRLFVRYIGAMACLKLIYGYASEAERAKFREYMDTPEAREQSSSKKKIDNLWMQNVGDYSVPISRPVAGSSLAVKSAVEIVLNRPQPRLKLEAGDVVTAELSIEGWALLLDRDGDALELGPGEFRLATSA